MKGEIGDKFPKKVGLKHDEPNARNVLHFYDRMMRCTRSDLDRKWFKHVFMTLVLLCDDDFIAEFGPDGGINQSRLDSNFIHVDIQGCEDVWIMENKMETSV